MNEYEIYEPLEVDDEFYDQMCTAAFCRMFSEGRSFNLEDSDGI